MLRFRSIRTPWSGAVLSRAALGSLLLHLGVAGGAVAWFALEFAADSSPLPLLQVEARLDSLPDGERPPTLVLLPPESPEPLLVEALEMPESGRVEPVRDPRHSPPPSYPRHCIRLGQEGVVQVQVWVSADGAVLGVGLARSSGFPALDAAALEAVHAWEFLPAHLAGRAVPSRTVVQVRFRLEDRVG